VDHILSAFDSALAQRVGHGRFFLGTNKLSKWKVQQHCMAWFSTKLGEHQMQ
jgi:hypothetical protein